MTSFSLFSMERNQAKQKFLGEFPNFCQTIILNMGRTGENNKAKGKRKRDASGVSKKSGISPKKTKINRKGRSRSGPKQLSPRKNLNEKFSPKVTRRRLMLKDMETQSNNNAQGDVDNVSQSADPGQGMATKSKEVVAVQVHASQRDVRESRKPDTPMVRGGDDPGYDLSLAASDDDFDEPGGCPPMDARSSDGSESAETSSSDSDSDDSSTNSSDSDPTRDGRHTPTVMLSREEVKARMRANPSMNLLVKELAEDRVTEELQKLGVLQGSGQYERGAAKASKSKLVKSSQKGLDQNMASPQFSREVRVKKKRLKDAGLNGQKVKSPSDTTLYTPALKQGKRNQYEADRVINQISNFVEGIRLESSGGKSGRGQDVAYLDKGRNHDHRSPVTVPRSRERPSSTPSTSEERAHERADKIILTAEKQKASINAPTDREVLDSDFAVNVKHDNNHDLNRPVMRNDRFWIMMTISFMFLVTLKPL